MSKFKPNPDQLYRDEQLKNLYSFMSKFDWDSLRMNKETFIIKDEKTIERKQDVFYYTNFDVIETDCFIHPEKPHKEEFLCLPSYIISGDYAKYLIHKETKYKEIVKTGYPILDFKFPDTVEITISPITHLHHKNESFAYFKGKEANPALTYASEIISDIFKKFIKSFSLPYTVSVDIDNNIPTVLVYSKDLPPESKPLFRFKFGPIQSLEIVMIKGLQIDSSKMYHC